MNGLDHIILLLVSLVANTFSAFSGGGAGLIQFPVLLFLGLSFGVALATHKVASVALGVGAALRYLSQSVLERQFVLLMLLFGIPGVILGANLILLVPDRLAEIALGLLTGGPGVCSVVSTELGQSYDPHHRDRTGLLFGGGVLFYSRCVEWIINVWHGIVCHAVVGALVWYGLPTCSGLYLDDGRSVLEWQWGTDIGLNG